MRKKIVLFLITICCLVVSADAASKKFTLVIDAGHGGHDTGAVGAISKEKNLTLKFALAFGRLVERNCPDVRVIYTRKTDVFVELYKRAEVANRNKADLFISIHINALPRGRVARGFQTYTLGSSKRTGKKTGVTQNLEVAKRENSVIFLEKTISRPIMATIPTHLRVTSCLSLYKTRTWRTALSWPSICSVMYVGLQAVRTWVPSRIISQCCACRRCLVA